jgi:hypothetical protein
MAETLPVAESAEEILARIEAEKFERVKAAAQSEIPLAQEMAGRPDALEKAAEAKLFAGTPVGFARNVLGLGLYQWQADVLTWFEDTTELVKGSLCTPNGAGKSAFVDACLALWWITVHPQGVVVITTKDSKQLDNQLWPAIERHKAKFPKYDFIERMVRNGTGGFIIGFTTDDPGRAEGWHKINDFTGPLLMIGDEAKSIADGIHMALDRCTYNAKLLSSSPGLTEGLFWKSQYNQPPPPIGYHVMRVGLLDCPHIPQSRIDNIIATYGPDHWFTRSTLHAEFTDVDSDVIKVIPKHIVRNAMENPPAYVPGGHRAFCDFGAGSAENSFTYRKGNRVTQENWKDPDPMRAVLQFVSLFVRHQLLPSEIKADAGGIGIPILARFRELGWPIIGVNNESEAKDKSRYPNKGSEDWHSAPLKIPGLILPNDPVLLEQLTARRAAPADGGRLGLEKKEDMARRGVASPDRADSLVGNLADDIDGAGTLIDQEGLSKLEQGARAAGRVETGKIELAGNGGARYERSLDGWLTVFEKPISGMSYVCVVSPTRHDDPLGNHCLIIIRSGYWDEKEGALRPARLAAKVNVSPFRLDAGPLVEMVKKVTFWYGRCIVIPVVNDRGDVIERLLREGIHIYAREDFEATKHGRTQNALKFGWENNDFNRSMWIGTLAEQVRQDKIVVEDVETVMQLYQLDGRVLNLRDAEALGVGLQLINYASSYTVAVQAPRWTIERQPEPEETMYS